MTGGVRAARIPREDTLVTYREGLSRPDKKSPRNGDAGLSLERSALRIALRLLRYRDRSEEEMRGRLKMKGFEEETIDDVIRKLVSQGLLNDRNLAQSLKRYAAETKRLGVAGTRRFLRQRGIPDEIIDETVKDMDEAEAARKVVEKRLKLLERYPKEKILGRLYGVLSRRGYSSETIRKTLGSLALKEDS